MQTQNLFALSLFKLQEHCLTAKTDRQETDGAEHTSALTPAKQRPLLSFDIGGAF